MKHLLVHLHLIKNLAEFIVGSLLVQVNLENPNSVTCLYLVLIQTDWKSARAIPFQNHKFYEALKARKLIKRYKIQRSLSEPQETIKHSTSSSYRIFRNRGTVPLFFQLL